MQIIKADGLLEFDNHELVVKVEEPSVGLLGFIAIHRIDPKHPALGATRLWNYSSEEEVLNDALRLAKLMGYKSALAGLPYTGAKAALMMNDKVNKNRQQFFKIYAQKVNELAGKFVTGTDVGVDNDDLKVMCQESEYMIGRGIDSGYYTGIGVFDGVKVALERVFGTSDVSERTFAIQGLGKTGSALLKHIYKKCKKIYVSDISTRKAWFTKLLYPEVQIVDPKEIHKQNVDVLSPCALSHTVTEKSIEELKCRIIAGSANNQLSRRSVGEMLYERGILYAPDFVINAGGIISVVDEFENGRKHDEGRILRKIEGIGDSLRSIFEVSLQEKRATNIVAGEIAESIVNLRKEEGTRVNVV